AQEEVRVIHAAAVFNEATDEDGNREAEQAQDYAVIDNERARKLGTLGVRALETGRPASAKRMFDKALRANPRSRLALAGLGRWALDKKRFAQAVDYLERAVKIEPRKADNRRYLGDAYAGQGRIKRARRQYEKAASYGDAIAAERLAALE
ncbi:MAG: tetratricopeptide repeat protein, partial [Myxococcota bacterium]